MDLDSFMKAATMTNEILPEEIVTDILSRLPVKSLCRFKCASPSWNSLISDPEFAKTHLNRTKTKSSKYPKQIFLINSLCGNLYSLDHNDVNLTFTKLEFPTVEQHDAEWVQVLCSCDGMLVISRSDKSVFLLNPSTRECKKLPVCPFVQINTDALPDGPDVYGFGYDSSTDDYKVLLMLPYFFEYFCDIGTFVVVAVYSLKTNAWRILEDFQYGSRVRNSTGVFLNGFLYYLYRKWNGSESIIAFDLSDEVFKEVPLPSFLVDSIDDEFCRLEVLGDCLCLLRQHNDQVDVWMREENGVGELWSKLTIGVPGMSTVELLCLLGEKEYMLKANRVIGGIVYEEKLVMYDLKKETMRDMVIFDIPTKFTFGAAYVESLISPNHVGEIGSHEREASSGTFVK